MKKLKVILIGAGDRGRTYTNHMAKFDGKFEVVAVAEPIDDRREYIKNTHNIPDNMCFTTWEPILEMEKFADLVVICTMDRDHFAPAMAAIEKGYDMLLEKPAAPTPEECAKMKIAAKEKGVKVLVCHVLRYTPFFGKIKEIIDSGRIGRVITIEHDECVGIIHQSHSFVRGNWGNSERSSTMLLQKSCHDMDILQWLVGKKAKRVSSFGHRTYFTAENAPEGAPEYCYQGCPHADTCIFNAEKLYLEDKKNNWFRGAATKKAAPTDEDVYKAIRETQYGKCVYKCDNDVVDHQVVNLEFEDDVLVSFNMNAFNAGGRHIKVMGTKGEVYGCAKDKTVELYDFQTGKTETIDTESTITGDSILSGHGGGDPGIVNSLYLYLTGQCSEEGLSEIGVSIDNHMIAFAAEEARTSGTVVDVEEYKKRFNV